MPNYTLLLTIYLIGFALPIYGVFYSASQYSPVQLILEENIRRWKASFFSCIICFVMVIFNLIYTGFFGWSMGPNNAIHMLLDLFTGIIMFVCILVYYCNYRPRKEKQTA